MHNWCIYQLLFDCVVEVEQEKKCAFLYGILPVCSVGERETDSTKRVVIW